MSVSGLCEICSSNEIEFTCDRCGKLVCEQHYDEKVGLCVECAAEVERSPGDTPDRDRSDYPDGVDEYQF